VSKKEFGDFQTSLALVEQVLAALEADGTKWSRVLEPTCGRGNFIRGVLELERPPQEIIGIELQDRYIQEARKLNPPPGVRLNILNADIFTLDIGKDISWQTRGPLLVIGNPPWVTNAEIGALGGSNLPEKSNFKGRRGIDAITGHANFDIAEFIWIKLIRELATEEATIALLCKTSVARNILQYCHKVGFDIANATIRLIDAKRWFDAGVDACLFTLTLNSGSPSYEAKIFSSLSATTPKRQIGFAGHQLVSDITKYRELAFIDGKSPFEWRQGIKHDAAAVMELSCRDGVWRNGQDERVEVEDEYIYPLLKSSDLRSASPTSLERAVIVPQTRVGQNTRQLETVAPRLWRYLTSHSDAFTARKSSIYKGKPPFSIFGIGDYSFAAYKVLISGLYKKPHFIVIGPYNGKPVMCDDTCYLLPFESAVEAAIVACALNHPFSLQFIETIIFGTPNARLRNHY